jgi:hypothetical protein
MILKNKKPGSIAILIACVVLVFLAISSIVCGAGTVSDRTGVQKEESTITNGNDNTNAPIVPGGCSDVITKARDYLNRGIRYPKQFELSRRCGLSNSKGPIGVTVMDCSGYASRVYRDAGLLAMNACLDTAAFAYSRSFQRIATTPAQAKTLWQPGDYLLFGLGDPSGPVRKDPNYAHIVMFGGSSGNNQIIYESGGSGGGPHVSTYNVFGGGRGGRFYGLYRATKDCSAETGS